MKGGEVAKLLYRARYEAVAFHQGAFSVLREERGNGKASHAA
jgi:hypothetical protein